MTLPLRALLLLGLSCVAEAQNMRAADEDNDPDGGGDPGAQPSLNNWVGNSTTAPILPSRDPFYHQRYANLTAYLNGAIILQRDISVDGSYQGVESALQILYRTEDAHGKATMSTASVLKAHSDENSGRLVVFQVPEEAVSIDCSPTYEVFGRNGIPEIQHLLTQGYSVVVPDYEGERGSFTVGSLAGKQILDSARAALKIPDLVPRNLTAAVGLWGYGTAAHATGWAAELAASYAPELPIKGVAIGGVVANLLNWVRSINSSPLSGQVVASLLGMASEYKDVSDLLAEEVLPRRRSTLEAAQSRCETQNMIRYFEQNITSEFFSPGVDPFSEERVANVYNLNSLGKHAPRTSLFVYQGANDNVASTAEVRKLVKNYCNNGTPVRYREFTGASHGAVRGQYDDVVDYFDDALAGSPPVSSCNRIKSGNYL